MQGLIYLLDAAGMTVSHTVNTQATRIAELEAEVAELSALIGSGNGKPKADPITANGTMTAKERS